MEWKGQTVYTTAQVAERMNVSLKVIRSRRKKTCYQEGIHYFQLTDHELTDFCYAYELKKRKFYLWTETGVQALLRSKKHDYYWKGQKVYTTEQAAEFLGVKGATLYKRIRNRLYHDGVFCLRGDELIAFKEQFDAGNQHDSLFLWTKEGIKAECAQRNISPNFPKEWNEPSAKESNITYQRYLAQLYAWANQRPKISIHCYEKKVYARRVFGI